MEDVIRGRIRCSFTETERERDVWSAVDVLGADRYSAFILLAAECGVAAVEHRQPSSCAYCIGCIPLFALSLLFASHLDLC